jgi:hypothetical protein
MQKFIWLLFDVYVLSDEAGEYALKKSIKTAARKVESYYVLPMQKMNQKESVQYEKIRFTSIYFN